MYISLLILLYLFIFSLSFPFPYEENFHVRYAHTATGFVNTLGLLQLYLIMPTGSGSNGHRGGGESPYEEDAIARLSNQLVQLSARVEANRQQRAKEAEAERKR